MEYAMYFAYGSNMNLHQMAFRCPQAQRIGPVRLNGYRLAFRSNGGGCGVATVLRQPGSNVDGVLWRISTEDERSLDAYEGFPRLYKKERLTVEGQDGTVHEVMAYTMNAPYRDIPAYPSAYYLGGILMGLSQNGMEIEPVRTAAEKTGKEMRQWNKTHTKKQSDRTGNDLQR